MILGVHRTLKSFAPQYMTRDSAAFDLAVPEDVRIDAYGYKEIQFDLVFSLPPDCILYIRPRNSTFKKYHLIFVGSGIVDEDYCGPEDKINFPVYNPTKRDVTIARGTRIAQGMVLRIERPMIVPYLPKGKSRGGTGSTG